MRTNHVNQYSVQIKVRYRTPGVWGGVEFSLLLGAALVNLCHSPWQQALGEGLSTVGGACSTAALIYAHLLQHTNTHLHE